MLEAAPPAALSSSHLPDRISLPQATVKRRPLDCARVLSLDPRLAHPLLLLHTHRALPCALSHARPPCRVRSTPRPRARRPTRSSSSPTATRAPALARHPRPCCAARRAARASALSLSARSTPRVSRASCSREGTGQAEVCEKLLVSSRGRAVQPGDRGALYRVMRHAARPRDRVPPLSGAPEAGSRRGFVPGHRQLAVAASHISPFVSRHEPAE